MAPKKLLFITPVTPSTQGRGRNHRAFLWVNHLRKSYDVSVVCTAMANKNLNFTDQSLLHSMCNIFEWEQSSSYSGRLKKYFFLRPGLINRKGRTVGKQFQKLNIPKPDIIVCFRLQTASIGLQVGAYWNVKNVWLDLDELDSGTKAGIAKLMFSAGNYTKLPKLALTALRYSYQESRLISQFDKVFTSTIHEKKRIEKKFHLKDAEVFENRLPVWNETEVKPTENRPFKFLFVGNSSYFPNRDAIKSILYEIIPELKKIATKPFRFVIIGGNVEARQHKQIKKLACVDFYKDSEDLNSIYNQIHAVIVPLRTGGGSSLKFLEALKFRKPVVSSVPGIRGFSITNAIHALVGRDSKEIASRCNTLMDDEELYEKLSENGYQWFIENNAYEIEGVQQE